MKTVKNYTDYGFGFPVVIDRVEMRDFEGEEVPFLNLNALEERVIRAMPDRTVRLTGNEVRFVRQHFGLTLAAFGKSLGVSHAAVKQWEQKYNEPTDMEWAKEKNLRLFILRSVGCSDQDFVRLFDGLEKERPTKSEPLRITMEPWQPYSFEKCGIVQSKKTGAQSRETVVSAVLHASHYAQKTRAHADYDRVPGNYADSKKTGATNGYCIADAA